MLSALSQKSFFPALLLGALLVAFDLAYGDVMINGAVGTGQPGMTVLTAVLVAQALVLPVLLARLPQAQRMQTAPPVLRATAVIVPVLLGWALAVIVVSLAMQTAAGTLFAATGALFGLLLLHAWGFIYIAQVAPQRWVWMAIGHGLGIAAVWSGVDLVLAAQGSLSFTFALAATVARLLILPMLGFVAGRWGPYEDAVTTRPLIPASSQPAQTRRPLRLGTHLIWIALAAFLLAVFFTPVGSGQDLSRLVQYGVGVFTSWGALVVAAGIVTGGALVLARLRGWLSPVWAGLGRLLRTSANTPARQTLWATLGLLLLCFWPYLDPYLLGSGTDGRISVMGDIGFYVILALGLNIVVGFAGLLDLGYVAFFAIGAYCWALLGAPQFSAIVGLVHQLDGLPLVPQQLPFGLAWAWWFWPCLLIGAVIAAGFGIVLGAPTLRLRGDYLAIVTLGFGEIIPIVFKNLPRLTGGINGIVGVPSPILPGLAFPWFAATPFYYLVLALIGITIISCRRLRGARLGRAWEAMRDDQLAAATSGINTARVKLLAFSTGAFFSGMAGVYHASKLGIIDPSQFNFGDSASYVTMVVLGGMGSIPGVIAGAVVIATLNLFLLDQLNAWAHDPTTILGRLPLLNTIDFANIRNLIFGMLLFAMVVLRPEGIIPARLRRQEEPEQAPAGSAVLETDMPSSPDTKAPRLRIQRLSKSFGGVTALSDLSLEVPPGQIVGIIGPNGSGKTTLFNLISGVVPPDALPDTALTVARRALRRVSMLAVHQPGRLVRWALETALGLGAGLLLIGYILNIFIFAAISDAAYLQPLVTLCAVAWTVIWLARRCAGLFLGPADGLWAELDDGSGALSGYAGAVRLDGHTLLGLPPEQIAARGVARTYQHIRLFDSMSVLDNLLVGQHARMRATWLDALLRSRRARGEDQAARDRAIATLALFGADLVARRHETAAYLAYADRRRVEICRALVSEPCLLLLDEPTAGMNEDETRDLLAVLRRVCAERQVTTLLIEHKMSVIDEVDHVVVLDQGRVIASGMPQQVRGDQHVIAAYLGQVGADQ